MSVRAPDNTQRSPRLAAERHRALGRSRRSSEGSVTEMARLLLRDARERSGPAAAGGEASRRFGAGAGVRLRPRPIATRRA
jgi:hypothetical protein